MNGTTTDDCLQTDSLPFVGQVSKRTSPGNERAQNRKEKSKGTVELIGRNRTPVKVCDVINGKPTVKQVMKDDCIEFVLRYSLFHKEIKRYNKKTFAEME